MIASSVVAALGAWTARAVPSKWAGIACSSDGTKGIAVTTGIGVDGLIFLTGDAGVTWTPCSISGIYWRHCAISPDGSFLIAVGDANINAANLYTSTDFGVTWIKRTTGKVIRDVCLNTNGSKIMYTSNEYVAYFSTDAGVNFNPSGYAGTGKVVACACSDDFTKIILGTHLDSVAANDFIYVSTNSGASFSAKGSRGIFDAVECSGNGAVMLAADSTSGFTRYSKNTGTAWANTSIGVFYGAGLSLDGSKLVLAGEFAGAAYLYSSTDFGDTWIEDTTSPGLSIARCAGNFGIWMGIPKYGFTDYLFTRA